MADDGLPPGGKAAAATPPAHVYTATETTAELKYLRGQVEKAHQKFASLDSSTSAAGMSVRELVGAVFVEQARQARTLERIEKTLQQLVHLVRNPRKRKARR